MLPGGSSALAVLAGAAVFTALALLDPDRTAALLAKEGPVEHASHLLLLLAVLAWLAAARRRRLALAMASFLALVLAEELDWGAVYGWPTLGLRLRALVGHGNFHNAVRGSSYLLFAVPLVAYFALLRRGPLVARPGERLAFVAIAVLFLACNFTAWERHGQELLEAELYALLLAIGLRVALSAPRGTS